MVLDKSLISYVNMEAIALRCKEIIIEMEKDSNTRFNYLVGGTVNLASLKEHSSIF